MRQWEVEGSTLTGERMTGHSLDCFSTGDCCFEVSFTEQFCPLLKEDTRKDTSKVLSNERRGFSGNKTSQRH
jgi:hypothetical protein